MVEKFGEKQTEETKTDRTPFKEPLQETGFAWKIKSLAKRPDKLVREINPDRLVVDSKTYLKRGNYTQQEFPEFVRYVKRGFDMFKKLKEKYELPVVDVNVVAGEEKKDPLTKKKVFVVVDKIYGENIKNLERLPSSAEHELDDLLLGLAKHFLDVYKNGGDYWDDFKLDQIVWGQRYNQKGNHLYIVDVEPIFANVSKGDYRDMRYPLERLEDIIDLMGDLRKKFDPPAKFSQTLHFLETGLNRINDERNRNLIDDLRKKVVTRIWSYEQRTN